MSVNASKHELVQLIYRHLKEHGFHSAADELHNQSPQNITSTSATLLDIYSSWLKSSKRTSKTATSKRSTPDKDTTHKKATQKKTTKQLTANKKTTPTKRKKSGKATGNADKSNKSNTQGEDDSDSDSSLDIEKWKKLVRQMTDTDVAKMDAVNALTAPKQKKQRKPRTKPPAKSQPQKNDLVEQKEKTERATEDVSAKVNKTKRSRPKKVTPVAFTVDPNQKQIISSETQITSVVSPSKQTPQKKKRKAVTPTDQSSLEPTKKKKKATKDKFVEKNGNVVDLDSLTDKTLEGDENGNSTEVDPTDKSKVHSVENKQRKKKKKEATKEKVQDKNGNVVDLDRLTDKTLEGDENGKSTEVEPTEKSKVHSVENKQRKKKKEATKEKVQDKNGNVVDLDRLTDKTLEGDTNGNSTEVEPTEKSKVHSVENKQKKKKKEEATKEKVGGKNGNVDLDSLIDKNVEDKNGNPSEGDLTEKGKLYPVENEPKKKKKKDVTKEKVRNVFVDTDTLEDVTETNKLNTANLEIESLVKVKKVKKKKKTKDDGDSEQIVTEADGITDTVNSEEINQNTEEMVPKKRKKKKGTEILAVENTNVTLCDEDNCGPFLIKKKSKKKKRESLEDLVSEQPEEEKDITHKNKNTPKTTESCDGNETLGQTPKPKKKKLSSKSIADTQLLSSPAPSLSTKKKKSRLEPEEIATVSLQVDAASQISESETPRKKKKKSSKSSETES